MEDNDYQEFAAEGKLVLKLFVSGMTVKSMEAVENIRKLCDEYLDGAFELEIVDLYKNPEAASEQQIIFSPSLLKESPLPKKTLVGTFSDVNKVVKALGITIKR